MTAPLYVRVEIAFDAGPATASPTWTDVSSDVSLVAGISFNRGRGQTSNTPEPGRLQLTLNNDDGDYTWGKTGGAYGLGRGDKPPLRQPIRVIAVGRAESVGDGGVGYDSVSTDYDAADVSYTDERILWTGYVDEWAQEWDNGWRPRVRVTASDRLAKLAVLNLDNGAIMSEVLADSPVAYYPLDEPAGAVSAGSRAGAVGWSSLSQQDIGAGAGAVDFGAGVSPDSTGTAVALTQTTNANGKSLTGTGPDTSHSSFTVEIWAYAAAWSTDQVLCSVTSTTTLDVYGPASIGYFPGIGDIGFQVNSTNAIPVSQTPVTDEWCHFALTCDGSTIRGYYQGAEVGNGGTSAPTSALFTGLVTVGSSGPADRVVASVQSAFDGQLAHFAVYDTALSAARIEEHWNAGRGEGPFYGDTASERFERLCRLGALPTGSYATDAAATVLLDQQPLGGIGLLDAIQAVTTSERGIVAADGDGVLTYTASATLAAAAVALTLDNDDIEGDLSLYVNDQTVVNDVTVTRPNGATQRRADTVSQAVMGVTNAITVDTLLTTDAAAGALADRLLSEGTAVQPVTGDLTVDLLTKSSTVDVSALLGIGTGDRVQVTNLPASAPVSTLDLRVEGVTANVSDREFRVVLTCSPALTVAPWLLDDATYSVLDQTTKLAWP